MRNTNNGIMPICVVLACALSGTGCVSKTSPADITKVYPASSHANLTAPQNAGDQVQIAQLKEAQSKEPSESRKKSLIEKTRFVLELERQGVLSEKEAEDLIRRAVNDGDS